MPSFRILKYSLATILDTEFAMRTEPIAYLDHLLAKHGECDNDAILEMDGPNAIVLYRWCSERSAWQMVQ